MRKPRIVLLFCITAAMTVAGVLMWKAEATPLTGAADSLAVIRGFSAVHKTGCMFGTSRCPAGTKWVCTKHPASVGTSKKCYCRAC
jgi:hypothetical protein